MVLIIDMVSYQWQVSESLGVASPERVLDLVSVCLRELRGGVQYGLSCAVVLSLKVGTASEPSLRLQMWSVLVCNVHVFKVYL